MPSFNQGAFLEAAISSVLNQDYPRKELIVIDGGSTDNTVEIIEKYSDRLAHWSSEPDEGQSDALNKGFKLVSGDIVGWLNSDDTFQPGAFWEVARAFERPGVNVVMARHFGLMDQDGYVYATKENRFIDRQTLIRYWTTDGMTVNQPSVFLRKRVLEDSSPMLDSDLHFAMDYDLWLRITRRYPIKVVDGHWANYRFHATSKSGVSFVRFYPEWYSVSKRYWGSRASLRWWKNWFGHAAFVVKKALSSLFKKVKAAR